MLFMYLCEVAIVSQLCIFPLYLLHGLCEDYLTCDIAFNAVMPLSRASTRGRYRRIEGVTMPILAASAVAGADGSRRCGSFLLESMPRAPSASSCSTPPCLLELGFAFLPSLPPSSRREDSWSCGCSTPVAALPRTRQRSRSPPR